MGKITKKDSFVIVKFLERYAYDAVEDILKESYLTDTDLYKVVSACKYSVTFDFETSLDRMNKIKSSVKNNKQIKVFKKDLQEMKAGKALPIFCQLLENIYIKYLNEEYIDFLGRVYRLKEATLKYMFISKEMSKNEISMHGYMMSKKNIMKILKKQYRIYNGNLSYGLTEYIQRYMGKRKYIKESLDILNSVKMENLISLRNDSPAGHGFKGVSKTEIFEIYGDPEEIIKDFVKVLYYIEIDVVLGKYEKMNECIIELMQDFISKEEVCF